MDPGSERITTGVPRLDFILGGGLLRRNVYLLLGDAGAGKTVIANQIACHQVREGGCALVVTLLSEPTDRLVRHMSSFGFFDQDVVAERLWYVSGYQALTEGGLPALRDLAAREVRHRSAGLLVIDGVRTARMFAPSRHAYQEFVRGIQSHAELLGCTVLLLSADRIEDDPPEAEVVDGILTLHLRTVGPREVREVVVQKLRGSDHLPGRHQMEIGEDGVVIHPRTEVRFSEPRPYGEGERSRRRFGVERLDDMLHGGLVSGTTTLLSGAPGTGKTTLALQFLAEGGQRGEPGVYFGFYETPDRLLAKARAVGIDLTPHVEAGLVEIQWQPPLEHTLDSLAERLLDRIRERGEEHLRVVVDGFGAFRQAAVYDERLPGFFSALTHELRNVGCTSLVIEETEILPQGVDQPDKGIAVSVEAVLMLRYVELRSQIYRLVSILKNRESDYETSIREFSITARGVVVSESFRSAERVLSGFAHSTERETGSGSDRPSEPRRRGAAGHETGDTGTADTGKEEGESS